jgi:serine/threonine-protein kinase HipA
MGPQDKDYQELTGAMLPGILRELPTRPLLAGENGIRLSLAGVQDKIAVYIDGDRIYIPLNNAPSTHIIKPDFSTYEGVIFNEAFCLSLAKKIGLSVADAEIKKTEDINYLLVKRYDRIYAANESDNHQIMRVHQEDFCQALGVSSANKYQHEGGPSLKQCFDLLRKESAIPVIDLDRMINAVIYNFLIGNCDAHGKNFSLLYHDELQLSPLYDLISTVYYRDLDQKMAMKLGGEYKIHHITPANFDVLADEVGLAKPEVRRRIQRLIDSMLSHLPLMEIHNHVESGVSEMVKKRCEDFATQMRAGK